MTARWMLGAVAAGILLALAARCAEPVAAWFRLPRRWIWGAAMAGSVCIPLLAAIAPGTLPRIHLPAAPAGAAHATVSPSPRTPGSPIPAAGPRAPLPPPRPLPAAVYAVWMLGAAATLGALAWAQRRVARACGRFERRRVAGVRVLVSDRAGPMVLGVLDPQIVLPRWVLGSEETSRVVVRHEREHLTAGDPWLLAVAAFAVAAMPWSPALWWMHRRLRLAVETDCDARVLSAGESRRGYVNALLDTAGRREFRAELAWAGRRSHLEHRLLALTAPRPRLRWVRAMPLVAVALAGIGAACRVGADTAVNRPRAQAASPRPDAAPFDTVIATMERLDGRPQARFSAPTPRRGERRVQTVVEPSGTLPIGFTSTSVSGDTPGGGAERRDLIVQSVVPGSPADRAGLRRGDRVVAVNGVDARRLLAPMSTWRVAYTVRVRRGNEDVTLSIPPSLFRVQAEQALRIRVFCEREMEHRASRRDRSAGRCFEPERSTPAAVMTESS